MYEVDFEKLVKQHDKLMNMFLRRYNLPELSREDFRQEMLMMLHWCNQNYDASRKTRFSSFFYTKVMSFVKDHLRKHSATTRGKLILDNDLIMSTADSLDEDFSDLENDIKKTLNDLHYGFITYEIYFNNKTMTELAKDLGVSVARISKLNAYNITILKDTFKDYFK